MKPTFSIIIPVYNEEGTIASIVEVVRSWGNASEIIVVNDGSTDHTASALKQFGDAIVHVPYVQNRGKGYALVQGIRRSKGDVLVFLDGDIIGLTHRALDLLVAPIVKNRADMVIGLVRTWGIQSMGVFDALSGQRVIQRNFILPYVKKMERTGYGVEFLLNDAYKNKRVVSVRLPYVYILGKWDKQRMSSAMRSYVREARELVAQLVRQQTNDLTPQARSIFRAIQGYLKQALE